MTLRAARSVAMVVYNDLMHDARVHREASTLADAGYLVTVIGVRSSDTPSLVGWEGIPVVRLDIGTHRSLRLRYARFWRDAYGQLVHMRPDAIHAHDLDALLPAWLAAALLAVPLVYDAHELWTELPSLVGRPLSRGIWRALAAVLVHRSDAVITVADGIARELAKRYGVSPVVLRNLPPRGEPPKPLPLRDMVGCPAATPLFLYQGSLMSGYGLDRAIAAMERLPGGHLVIIGSGPLGEGLREQARRSSASDRISFLPAVPFAELPRYTTAADIGLFLGESEGLNLQLSLPNKVFEYIAAGIPLVSTDWPEVGRLVRQYDVGRLVRPGAPIEEIVRAVEAVLDDRESLAENCRRAREELVWECDGGRLVECYHCLPWRHR